MPVFYINKLGMCNGIKAVTIYAMSYEPCIARLTGIKQKD